MSLVHVHCTVYCIMYIQYYNAQLKIEFFFKISDCENVVVVILHVAVFGTAWIVFLRRAWQPTV